MERRQLFGLPVCVEEGKEPVPDFPHGLDFAVGVAKVRKRVEAPPTPRLLEELPRREGATVGEALLLQGMDRWHGAQPPSRLGWSLVLLTEP